MSDEGGVGDGADADGDGGDVARPPVMSGPTAEVAEALAAGPSSRCPRSVAIA